MKCPSQILFINVIVMETVIVMSEMEQEVRQHVEAITLSYQLHQCSYLDPEIQPSRPQPTHADSVYTAVHSLNLHLQAALKK